MNNNIENEEIKNKVNKTVYLVSLIVASIGVVILGAFLIINSFNNKDADGLEYIVLDDKSNGEGNQGNCYYVQKNGSDYKVITKLESDYILTGIGYYDEKLYYVDLEDYKTVSIKYVDLKDDNKIKVWLTVPQPDCAGDTCGTVDILDAKIVDDTLYFNVSGTCGGTCENDGLLSLSMDATSFDEYKQISAYVEPGGWYSDENNKNIYYLNTSDLDKGIYVYNISSDNSEKLFEITSESDYDFINYIEGKVIYYSGSEDELSLYDVDVKTFKSLADEFSTDDISSWGICAVSDNYIYYYGGNDTIMQYDVNKDKSVSYYTLPDSLSYRGLNVYDENTIIITDTYYERTYVKSDGTTSDSINFNVLMLDDTIKQFEAEQIMTQKD